MQIVPTVVVVGSPASLVNSAPVASESSPVLRDRKPVAVFALTRNPTPKTAESVAMSVLVARPVLPVNAVAQQLWQIVQVSVSTLAKMSLTVVPVARNVPVVTSVPTVLVN